MTTQMIEALAKMAQSRDNKSVEQIVNASSKQSED